MIEIMNDVLDKDKIEHKLPAKHETQAIQNVFHYARTIAQTFRGAIRKLRRHTPP